MQIVSYMQIVSLGENLHETSNVLGILRKILYSYQLLSHWTCCDVNQRIPILTEALPRSI